MSIPFRKLSGITFIFLMLMAICFPLYSQVDATRYASGDLFSVKPVIKQADLPTADEEEDQYESQLQYDMDRVLDLLSGDNLAEAEKLLEQLIAQNEDVAALHFYMGQTYMMQREWNDAVSSFEETLRKEPFFLEARYFMAMARMELGDKKEAKNLLSSLTEVPKFASLGYQGLAEIAIEQNLFGRALQFYKKSLEADPDNLTSCLRIVQYYFYNGEFKRARRYIEEALVSNEDWENGIIIRAVISVAQDKNTDQFEQDINTLLTIDPANYHYWSIKGFLKSELEQYSEAVKMFEKAYRLSLDTVSRGEFKFNSTFKRELSVYHAITYLNSHPVMDSLQSGKVNKAICQLVANDKESAMISIDEAAEVTEHPGVFMLQGITSMLKGDPGEIAIESFDKSIALDSNNWVAYNYRGDEFYRKEDSQAAYDDYTKVIALQPKDKSGYKKRGILLSGTGQYRYAYEDFSVGVALDTTDYDLFFNRAICASNLGASQYAIDDLNHILKNKPNDSQVHYFLYSLKISLGDTLAAMSALDRASELNPGSHVYGKELIRMSEVLSQPEYRLKAYDRLIYHTYRREHYLFERAMYYIRTEKYIEAISDLNKILKRNPDSGRAYYILAEAMEKLGKSGSSQRYYDKAKELGYVPGSGG